MYNTYNSFAEASDSNWDLLVQLFGKSEKFKLIKPQRKNSVFDGILACKKDGKEICILIEVKRRQFTVATLQNEYDNTLFLEKEKYTYLHKRVNEYKQAPDRIVKVWYLSKTTDGAIFVHDITEKDYNWIPTRMNSVTYTEKQVKREKLVALLHTADALYCVKTNIQK